MTDTTISGENHHMRRLFMTIAATLLATTLLYVPGAAAQEAERAPDAEAEKVDEVRPERPQRPKIRCHGDVSDTGAPEVDCRWTESTHPDAAAYKILRVGGGERSVVFRTDDTSVTEWTDTGVEFGTRYRYRVVVLNEDGKRIQRSRWNKAIVVKTDIERLQMECDLVDAAADDDSIGSDIAPDVEGHPVLCQWRPADSEDAAEYQLWRRVRGQHRELVATVGLDTLSQRDIVPLDAGKVVYAVLAVDADGEIVGRSGLSKIRLPLVDAAA